MAKILNVIDGNYKIKVQPGGDIILDTGAEVGSVTITGNLVVEGTNTTVESENLVIKDNIIVINDGESSPFGITLGKAGINIDRGGKGNAQIHLDESIAYHDPASQQEENGAFVFRDQDGKLIGIRANSFSTGGTDLSINTGGSVITVEQSNDYTNNITQDSHIPNKRYVDDAIVAGIQGLTIKRIQQGDSVVELSDDSLEPVNSNFKITIDNNEVALFRANDTEIEGILFSNNVIETSQSGAELVLRPQATSSVAIDGIVRLTRQTSDPVASSGIKLYNKDPNYGDTGLYYVNSNSSDEVISTNRSLLYSMLF